jgi:hypothetical protein
MNPCLFMRFPLAVLTLLALCIPSLRADTIFGNLSGYTNDGGQSGAGSQINSDGNGGYLGKSISFLMGSTTYTVTDLTLRLANVNDTAGVDVPTVSIYTANASTGVPGTLVGTFTNPTFTAGSTAAAYVFTPASSITLNANTRYAVVVQQLNVTPGFTQEFNWMNGSTTVTPTSIGGIASSPIAKFGQAISTNPSAMTSSSSQYNWFQLTGTAAIPEPSTYSALAGAASLALVLSRRSRRQQQS